LIIELIELLAYCIFSINDTHYVAQFLSFNPKYFLELKKKCDRQGEMNSAADTDESIAVFCNEKKMESFFI